MHQRSESPAQAVAAHPEVSAEAHPEDEVALVQEREERLEEEVALVEVVLAEVALVEHEEHLVVEHEVVASPAAVGSPEVEASVVVGAEEDRCQDQKLYCYSIRMAFRRYPRKDRRPWVQLWFCSARREEGTHMISYGLHFQYYRPQVVTYL